jgi:hypothetical protein
VRQSTKALAAPHIHFQKLWLDVKNWLNVCLHDTGVHLLFGSSMGRTFE